jgi:hypothetical protein
MSVKRFMVVVPVLAGLVVTGSAAARMMSAQSVRDTVYQTCAHNGVHFNKQGHANCGLHLGWTQGEPGSEPGSTTTSDQSTGDAGTSDSGAATTNGGHATHVHPTHPSKTHGAKTHGAKTHSTTTHGAKAHGGGKSAHNKHG